ncbi:MAG: helix-turn-helix transcriptional regulator [Ruminococcaceae bacterium]|nr:helix-turn-helix transcriptional regulator [Oscillospiraceae bacterium]
MKKTMGEILKELRLERGLTQEEVGKIIGVQKAAIQKYEKGEVENMKQSSIKKLSKFYGVTTDYLLGIEKADEQLEEYLEMLKSRSELKMLFNLTKDATREDIEKAVKIIETVLER